MFLQMRLGGFMRACCVGACCLALASCTWSYRPIPPEDYVGPPPPAATPLKAAAAAGGAPTKPSAGGEGEAPAAGEAGGPDVSEGPIELDAQHAVLMALEHNQALVVERLTPAVVRTVEDEERAVFDPVFTGTVGNERSKGDALNSRGRLYMRDTESIVGEAAMGMRLPTGTSVELGASTEVADAAEGGQEKLVESRVGLTVTQALLRGFGLDANLAAVRQAKLDTQASQYELRAFAEALAGTVEATYWDYVLAKRKVDILAGALKVAEAQLEDTRQRVQAGTVAEMEVVAAEAEVALRQEALIDVRSDRVKLQLQLLRLLNPPGKDLWGREIVVREPAGPSKDEIDDVEEHVRVGLRMRPDLNQARLGIRRGDLQIVKTKNGLLPQMDLFITLGKSGYADSFSESWKRIDGDGYDILFGLNAAYPPINRAAEAQHRRAVVGRQQAREAVRNLEQIVQLDIRLAYVEVIRAREQMAATAATRKLDEAKVKVELENFGVGRASSFQVARAQRDLVKSQLGEAQATVDYQKAMAELFRLEGSLLDRRGIESPGREPVELARE